MWMWTYVNVKPINVFVVLSDNQIKRAVTSALYLRTKAQQVLKKAIVGAKQSIDNLWITVVAVEKKQIKYPRCVKNCQSSVSML